MVTVEQSVTVVFAFFSAMIITTGLTPTAGHAQGAAEAIGRIRTGPHADMPPAQMSHASGAEGQGMTIENETGHAMMVYFSGPVQRSIQVPNGGSVGVELIVGGYEVAAEVLGNTPDVSITPFYGRQTYETNAHYWLKFFLQGSPANRMIAQEGDVNAKDKDGWTPLMHATFPYDDAKGTYRGIDAAKVKALIAAGADVNARSNSGTTALANAAMCGDEDSVVALIAAGADVNAPDDKGYTPLMLAVMVVGEVDVAKALIKAGADVNAKNKEGKTATDYVKTLAMAQALLLTRPEQAPAKGEEYHALALAWRCGGLVANMEFTFGGAPSGDLTGFQCVGKDGNTRSIELKSTKMVNGKIETKDFGTILMTTTGTSAHYSMAGSNREKLGVFLGF